MLGYEWMNPFGAISSHLGEEPIHDEPQECHQILSGLDDRTSFGGPGTLFSIDPEPPAEDYSARGLFGLSPQLPPAPAPVDPEPAAGSAMRIGLNLGVRTYFASSPDGELMRLGSNVYRRSGGSLGTGNGGVPASVVVPPVCKARCQAEGCGTDLTRAKHYHRRHKVCEFHSKAAAVHVNGHTQRFCQQCSRFHVLSEFDQGKRSCRKRLADHNRRRRKTQPPLAPLPVLQQGSSGITPTAMNSSAPTLAAAAAAKPPAGDTLPPVAAATAPVPSSASPTRMALGMCFRSAENYVPGVINSSSSSSSPSSCSSRSTSSSVLHHLPDFGSYYRRVIPMSIWEGNVDE